jgi:hypothetical protein
MKIVLVQSGPGHDVLVLGSLIIGLHKKYQGSQIIWVGSPKFFDLVKYNRRIRRCVDIGQELTFSGLSLFYNTDLCINPSNTKEAKKFVSSLSAKNYLGFIKQGAVDRHAEFFHKVTSGEISTCKTILDLYFTLAGLKWSGEGYGLSYYPRKRQDKEHGSYLNIATPFAEASPINLPKKLLAQFDVINQFKNVHTDNLFVAHAAIALRKHLYFYADLPYKLEFFGKGKQVHYTAKDKGAEDLNT